MKFAALLFSLLIAVAAAAEVLTDPATRKPVRYAGRFSDKPVWLPAYRIRPGEMRGVWVATVENLDFGIHSTAASYRRDFSRIISNLKRAGFTAVFFQVRPHCDAFYASSLNPWSARLAGAEGRGIPGFDPLSYMVAETHRQGLQFHAWLNPYRVIGRTKLNKSGYLRTLAPGNFARRNPGLVLAHRSSGGGYSLFLNPGEPAVTAHIVATVTEIIRKYPVDGIHFDDYFYLYEDIGAIDADTYRRRNPGRLSLAAWRRANVTGTIRAVKQAVEQVERSSRRRIAFGVSPFGIWANRRSLPSGSLTGGKESYFTQYADTRGWVKNGLIDYIVPQLYWPFTHEVAAYAALADWWADTVRGTRVRLYIGQGFYRVGKAGWNENEIINQLRYNQTRPEIGGSIFFSYRHLFSPENATAKRSFYQLLRLWGVYR